MKILLVHPSLTYYGGAELVIVKLAGYLKEKGHKVTILTLSASEEIKKELYGTTVLNEEKVFDSGLFGIIGQIDSLNMNIRDIESEFDIVNIHNFPAELALRKTKTPSVWYCNEPPIYWLNPEAKFQFPHKLLLRYEKKIVKEHVNKACVADEFNAKRFKDRYVITPEIVPYGIDYDFFSQGNPAKAIEKYKLKDKFVVLQVGMITPQKNQMRSIQAIERLKNKIPNIKLVLAGDGSSYYALRSKFYALDKNLSKHITFIGNINRENIRDLYHACDVLIHPVKSQGGWLTPFECMCTGKPVIVSSEFTAKSILMNKGIGYVCDGYGLCDFEKKIKQIHEKEREPLNKMSVDLSKKYVKENLTWEKFGERMLEIFEEVKRK